MERWKGPRVFLSSLRGCILVVIYNFIVAERVINDRRPRGRGAPSDICIIRVIISFLNFFFFWFLRCWYRRGVMQNGNGKFDNLERINVLIRARERGDSFLLFLLEKYDARARVRIRQRRMFEDWLSVKGFMLSGLFIRVERGRNIIVSFVNKL